MSTELDRASQTFDGITVVTTINSTGKQKQSIQQLMLDLVGTNPSLRGRTINAKAKYEAQNSIVHVNNGAVWELEAKISPGGVSSNKTAKRPLDVNSQGQEIINIRWSLGHVRGPRTSLPDDQLNLSVE